MQVTERSALPWPRATFNTIWQWRHSWFWTILPAMFLASSACMVLMMGGATILEDRRLRKSLAPTELRASLERALQASNALLTADGKPTAWCTDTLHVLAERVLGEAIGDRTGDHNENGFRRAMRSGRLVLELHGSAGAACRFGSDEVAPTPMLRRQMERTREPGVLNVGIVSEHPDGWISTIAVRPAGGNAPLVTAGIYVLSPWTKLTRPGSLFAPLSVFILCMNMGAALVLVLLLIRRIKRADRAAAAWTLGRLGTRINDPGRDELSRLTHKFDLMADAMSGVIQVKQALAAAEERNRLARDLHDSAKQRAFALNLQLSAARESVVDGSGAARAVDAALKLTGQLQQDLSSVIRRLAAPTIAESGLRHVLTEAVDALLSGSGISWSLSLGADDEAALAATPEVPHQLFLITLEAVANALKHADCTYCLVICQREQGVFTWRIRDDGRNRLPSSAGSKGMGLPNMKLRAASLKGGSFDIASDETGGTVVTIRFRHKEMEPV